MSQDNNIVTDPLEIHKFTEYLYKKILKINDSTELPVVLLNVNRSDFQANLKRMGEQAEYVKAIRKEFAEIKAVTDQSLLPAVDTVTTMSAVQEETKAELLGIEKVVEKINKPDNRGYKPEFGLQLFLNIDSGGEFVVNLILNLIAQVTHRNYFVVQKDTELIAAVKSNPLMLASLSNNPIILKKFSVEEWKKSATEYATKGYIDFTTPPQFQLPEAYLHELIALKLAAKNGLAVGTIHSLHL